MFVVDARFPVQTYESGGNDAMILLSKVGRTAILTIDARENLNAMGIDDLIELRRLLVDCQNDETVRTIIITGAGDRAFCTGANLKETFPPEEPFSRNILLSRNAEASQGGYTRLFDLCDLEIWKPLIAAINGYCLGGGLELALQCDLRIANKTASFGLPEVKVASVPAAGGVSLLLRAIPSAIAMKMVLTGERIEASEAHRVGLISDLFEPDALIDGALALAERITGNGPLAVQMVKKLAIETEHVMRREAITQSNVAWGLLRDSADRKEGRLAFGEKRPPAYRGI